MENLFYNISQVLGITIIHSLWQGFLVWLSIRLLFACLPSLSSGKKHNLGIIALFSIMGWFIYTLIGQVQVHTWVNINTATSSLLLPHIQFPDNEVLQAAPVNYLNYAIDGYLPYLSALYFAGLVFNLLRMGLNWQKISLIKRTMVPADKVQTYVDGFCEKLNISNYVSVNFSRMIDVPCMIGFFKPIILLPVSLTTYLSIQEIEAILLHELSHIKRNDYLFNLVQQLITMLLFFNPFARLINRIINQERENRCDDLVVQITAQPLIYAQALLKLEQSKQVNLPLALAATGKQYHLLNRIERIMKTKKPIGNIRHLLVAIVIMAASISSIAWLNPTIKDGKLSIKKTVYTKALTHFIPDTAHKKVAKKNVMIKKAKSKSANIHSVSPYGITNDAELEKLSADVEKYSKALSKYYDSHEFKQQTELIEKKAKVIEDYYNRPDIRKLHDEQEQVFKEVQGNDAEINQLSKEMEEPGDKISAYYEGPVFKELLANLVKKYHIPHNRYFVSRDSKDWNENYKNFQEELSKNIPPEIKQYKKLIAEQQEKMHVLTDNPEFRERRERIMALRNNISLAYNNEDIRKQQMEVATLSEKLKARQYSPELKRQQKLLEEASEKLKRYTDSPAFKKKMEGYRKQVDAVIKDKTNYQDMQPSPADNF